ncbi:MAG: hypothetical protein IPF99_11140 [Deltaproteobacteria bacterium]|nr:hypothetical protein [Deltaproteobacteria bacterium]
MIRVPTGRSCLSWLAIAATLFVAACDGTPVVGSGQDASLSEAGFDAPTDTRPTCTGSQMLCGDRCVAVNADNANCGACGNACTGGRQCDNGVCRLSCPTGQVACSAGASDGGTVGAEICVLTATDRDHCGACGRRCGPGEVCSAGSCATNCAQGLSTCMASDGSRACADLQRDPRHCGACGTSCASGETCDSGRCVTSCTMGFTACMAPTAGAWATAPTSRSTATTAAPAAPCARGPGLLRGRVRDELRDGHHRLLGLVPRPPERPRQLRHVRP